MRCTGLVRGQKAKPAPGWSRARSSLARTSSRGRPLPPFGRLRASLCILGSSRGEQPPQLSIYCSTYLPKKASQASHAWHLCHAPQHALTRCSCGMQGLISAHSWPPSDGGPSHAGSRVLQPPNMQMTWSFPPRMLTTSPLPPAGPQQQQVKASQQGGVAFMRHLYKLHFGRTPSDSGCASLPAART